MIILSICCCFNLSDTTYTTRPSIYKQIVSQLLFGWGGVLDFPLSFLLGFLFVSGVVCVVWFCFVFLKQNKTQPWNTQSFTYLFLTQDQDTSRFNWMPRSKILPSAKLLSILKSLPHSISCCPRNTDMMPFSITNEERELGNLQRKQQQKRKIIDVVNQVWQFKHNVCKGSVFIYCLQRHKL